jgi:hypothetical protein
MTFFSSKTGLDPEKPSRKMKITPDEISYFNQFKIRGCFFLEINIFPLIDKGI